MIHWAPNVPIRSAFQVIWDSGASLSISPDEMDFAGPIVRPETKSVLSGIVKGTTIEGQGTIVWAVHDVKGETRLLKTQGYLVPKVKMRLLSTNALTQAYPDETLTSNSEGVSLSGSSNDLTRGQVTVELDDSTNLPTSTMWRPIGHPEWHCGLIGAASSQCNPIHIPFTWIVHLDPTSRSSS